MGAAQPDFSDKLVGALQHLPGEIFAVLDGGHVDGASAALKARKLVGRPLYLEGGDKGSVESGPHLVTVPNLYALEQLLEMAAGKPALVFWSWRHGADALYRHLRTINLVEIPDTERGSGYETVVFRHASPNVMASILPLLDPAQMSRLLGASAGLAMDAPDFGGVRLLQRPDGLPEMPRGYLRFEKAQTGSIRQSRVGVSNRKIARYLRKAAPEPTAGMNDAALVAVVESSSASGRKMGLRSEAALGRWSFLWLMTEGKIGSSPEVANLLKQPGHSPDQHLSRLIKVSIHRLADKGISR